MNEFALRLLSFVPAPRSVREWQERESVMVQIAALTGYPCDLIQSACREVASHYPVPAYQTLKRLYVELATGQQTALTQDFYRERKQQGGGNDQAS